MRSLNFNSEYVKKLRERLQESYELAVENSCKMNAKNKARFDLKVRAAELMPVDLVLVRYLSLKGDAKTGRPMGKDCPHCGRPPIHSEARKE